MPIKEQIVDHLHTLKRVKRNPDQFFCVAPDCYFKIGRELLFGKETACPECGKSMIMGYEELRRAFPKCAICRNPKLKVNVEKALTALMRPPSDEEKEA